jgi:hypothetical protein
MARLDDIRITLDPDRRSQQLPPVRDSRPLLTVAIRMISGSWSVEAHADGFTFKEAGSNTLSERRARCALDEAVRRCYRQWHAYSRPERTEVPR